MTSSSQHSIYYSAFPAVSLHCRACHQHLSRVRLSAVCNQDQPHTCFWALRLNPGLCPCCHSAWLFKFRARRKSSSVVWRVFCISRDVKVSLVILPPPNTENKFSSSALWSQSAKGKKSPLGGANESQPSQAVAHIASSVKSQLNLAFLPVSVPSIYQ